MELKSNFHIFDELLSKMGGTKIDWNISDIGLSDIEDISIELEKGLEIDISKLEIVGGVYSYKGEQLVVYIYETRDEKDYIFEYPEKSKRFHLRDCQTITSFKERDKFQTRYIGTNNKSGIFKIEVYSDESHVKTEEIEFELFACKNCLTDLNYKNYKTNRNQVWRSFSLTEFFEEYKTYFSEKPKYTCENIPKNEYPDNWEDISRNFRIKKNWKCELCNINLINHHNLLHTHHRNQAKFDNKESNLQALCVDCHSKQTGHENMYYSSKHKSLINKLKREQNL